MDTEAATARSDSLVDLDAANQGLTGLRNWRSTDSRSEVVRVGNSSPNGVNNAANASHNETAYDSRPLCSSVQSQRREDGDGCGAVQMARRRSSKSRGRIGSHVVPKHQPVEARQEQKHGSLPSCTTDLSGDQQTANFLTGNSHESVVDLPEANLPSSTGLHLTGEMKSTLDLHRSLENVLTGESGGLALSEILEFLRKCCGWTSLQVSDILDACMMHDELILFGVCRNEICLFPKEPSLSDAQGKSFFYKPVSLPEQAPNCYFPVTVTNVASPHDIALNIQSPATSSALSSLVTAMTEFYSDCRRRTALGRYAMMGSACAFSNAAESKSKRKWRRGVVTDVLDCDTVQVFDVDSGAKTRVLSKELCLLLPRFFELPCQAIKARLAKVQPLEGTGWDAAVSDRLTELSRDKVLMCSVAGSNFGLLYVLLCDTSGSEDTWLDTMLVNEGLASRCVD